MLPARAAVFILMSVLAVPTASAQTLTGTVAGQITDGQGAVLPGATVTLIGSAGARTQPTDSKGAYRFPLWPRAPTPCEPNCGGSDRNNRAESSSTRAARSTSA